MHKNRFGESRHIWPNRATIFAFHLRIPQVLNLSGKHFQNNKKRNFKADKISKRVKLIEKEYHLGILRYIPVSKDTKLLPHYYKS